MRGGARLLLTKPSTRAPGLQDGHWATTTEGVDDAPLNARARPDVSAEIGHQYAAVLKGAFYWAPYARRWRGRAAHTGARLVLVGRFAARFTSAYTTRDGELTIDCWRVFAVVDKVGVDRSEGIERDFQFAGRYALYRRAFDLPGAWCEFADDVSSLGGQGQTDGPTIGGGLAAADIALCLEGAHRA